MTHDAEFSLRDAMEVLRLLDSEPNGTFDIRRNGFRLQCARGTAAAKLADEAAREEPRRQTTLKAPVAGRFLGEAAVFAPVAQAARVRAGSTVGRIEVGGKATIVTASVDGMVAHACVGPSAFVEYGQTLLVIDVA